MVIESISVCAALAASLLAAAADLRRREIPDAIPLGLLAAAALDLLLGSGALASSAAGLALGAALGVAGFRLGAIGGGDAKLLAALGAALGGASLLVALAAGSLAGALLGARAMARGDTEIPFAPPLALGVAATLPFAGAPVAALEVPLVRVLLLGGGVALVGLGVRHLALARRAADRLGREASAPPQPRTSIPAAGNRAVALVGGVAATAALGGSLLLGTGLGIATGISALLGVAAALLVARRAERRALRTEEQLAAAIALASAALRAGASPNEAIERAARESEPPLAPALEATSRRLRLGDDPERALGALAARLPLATVRLFATALAAQWTAGGSFARVLASLAHSIRDRVDTARRIETQTASVRASLVAVVVANAAIAALGWAANPGSVEMLVRSPGGGALLAVTLWLQALALLWIAQLARRVR